MSMEWFTASDLCGLPGVASTKSGNIRKARREGWKSRPRKAQGGGLQYHITSLPRETQKHLLGMAGDQILQISDEVSALYEMIHAQRKFIKARMADAVLRKQQAENEYNELQRMLEGDE